MTRQRARILSLRAGRSSHFSEYRERVLEGFRQGGSARSIGEDLGVTHQTILNWIKRNPEFSGEVDRARQEARAAGRRGFHGMGRGHKREATEEQLVRVGEVLEQGGSRNRAAAAAGVKGETFNRWLEEDEDVRMAVERAESRCEEEMLHRIVKAADDPRNWTAAAWILERRFGEVYARKTEVTHKDRVRMAERLGASLADTLLTGLSDVGLDLEQQEAIRARMAEALEVAAKKAV